MDGPRSQEGGEEWNGSQSPGGAGFNWGRGVGGGGCSQNVNRFVGRCYVLLLLVTHELGSQLDCLK